MRKAKQRSSVVFWVNGKKVEVSDEKIFWTLADFLRSDLHLTGTKIVCAEGDCGACTVLQIKPKIGKGRTPAPKTSVSQHPGGRVEAVNSCILMIGQLDGCQLITIEGLSPEKGLHPLQQAFVDHHATQCGYCTPGFIMACAGWAESSCSRTPQSLKNHLTGNLCRCTGYDPILKAVQSISEMKAAPSVLLGDQQRRIEKEQRALSQDPFLVVTTTGEFYSPRTLKDALHFLRKHPAARILAGNTDLGVVYNKQNLLHHPGQKHYLHLGRIEALQERKITKTSLRIGSGTSLDTLEKLCEKPIPEFSRFLRIFASPQIKRVATIGGNIANASPIGDLLPPLLALDASLTLVSSRGQRSVPLSKFFIGYRKTLLRKGELIQAVCIPIPKKSDHLRFYKVSNRKDLDISTVSASFRLSVAKGVIQIARIAYGGMAAIPLRLTQLEKKISGISASDTQRLQSIEAEIPRFLTARGDLRSSEIARNLTAQGIYAKFLSEEGFVS
jgi:xanthine dehydrogenase small subunit